MPKVLQINVVANLGGATGRIAEHGDLEGVVKAIEELCAEDRETMRERCRKHALEHFDRDENYGKYIDLYEQILTNK